MSELRAISIKQPWLDLILKGKKTIELREWHHTFRGLIAIHSPIKIDYHAAHYFGYSQPWKLERGKVLAVANLDAVSELSEEKYNDCMMEHLSIFPFSGTVYSFRLSNIFQLPKPVMAKGKLGIFPLDGMISEKILVQLPTNFVNQI